MKKEKTIVSVLKDISTRLFISFYIFFNPGSWKPLEFSCNRLMVSPTDAKKEKSIKGCRHQPFLFLINSVCDGRDHAVTGKLPSQGFHFLFNNCLASLHTHLLSFLIFFHLRRRKRDERRKEK